jgi:hypothetical protein
LIVDDHPAFRAGVHAILERTGDIYVVAEAGNGEVIKKTKPLSRLPLAEFILSLPKGSGMMSPNPHSEGRWREAFAPETKHRLKIRFAPIQEKKSTPCPLLWERGKRTCRSIRQSG